jgi:sigma-54 dependent transcriptional regulator, flagellar regulatory protein
LLIEELILRMEREGRGKVRFSQGALTALARHPWAGNVRELANLVERMAIMHPDAVVGARDIPPKFRHLDGIYDEVGELPIPPATVVQPTSVTEDQALLPVNGLDLKEHIQGIERSLIQQALDDCGGVVARAAERLRLRRTTLVEKMRKYEMAGRGELSDD